MGKITMRVAAPALGTGVLTILTLAAFCDMTSGLELGGFVLALCALPFFGSLIALLVLETVIALELPWPRATSWYEFLHESTHGALLLTIGAFLWFGTIGVLGIGSFGGMFLGGNSFSKFLGIFALIPIVGMIITFAILPAFLGIYLGVMAYVVYTGYVAVRRLYRAPRSGFVENGVALQQPNDDDDDDLEGGYFGVWESNRG